MLGQYIIDNTGKVVLEPDSVKWSDWMGTHRKERIVQQDKVGKVQVSTVFLGLDRSFVGGKPVLFETMIFGGPHDEYQERYSSREAAIQGHKKALKMVKDSKR